MPGTLPPLCPDARARTELLGSSANQFFGGSRRQTCMLVNAAIHSQNQFYYTLTWFRFRCCVQWTCQLPKAAMGFSLTNDTIFEQPRRCSELDIVDTAGFFFAGWGLSVERALWEKPPLNIAALAPPGRPSHLMGDGSGRRPDAPLGLAGWQVRTCRARACPDLRSYQPKQSMTLALPPNGVRQIRPQPIRK